MKSYVIPESLWSETRNAASAAKSALTNAPTTPTSTMRKPIQSCSKEENCVNCQRCVTFCPTHAITIRKNPNANRDNANWTLEAIRDLKRQSESGAVILTGMGCDKPNYTYWDRLLLNASQVTNPSIDPLREPMEIRTYLGAKPDKLDLMSNGDD
jgi:ferredoxin